MESSTARARPLHAPLHAVTHVKRPPDRAPRARCLHASLGRERRKRMPPRPESRREVTYGEKVQGKMSRCGPLNIP